MQPHQVSSDATIADILPGYEAAKKAHQELINSFLYLINTIPMDSSMESNFRFLIAKVGSRIDGYEETLRRHHVGIKHVASQID